MMNIGVGSAGVRPIGITRSSAQAEGITDRMIRHRLRTGAWTTKKAGLYLPAGTDQKDSVAVHAAMIGDALESAGDGAVLSYSSAAVMHGLPTWGLDLTKVHLTMPRRSGGHRRPDLHTHVQPMAEHEIVVVQGLRVTSPARTVLDLCCMLPFAAAVVAADAALNLTLTSPDALADALQAARLRRGRSAAEAAIVFSDGRSASVGESISRVLMRRAGLPLPTLQFEIRGNDGQLIGRTDFAWEKRLLLGEYDGKEKYTKYLRPGQSSSDAVFAEKRREDRLRALGFGMVRWTWADLSRPDELAAAIRRAMASAA